MARGKGRYATDWADEGCVARDIDYFREREIKTINIGSNEQEFAIVKAITSFHKYQHLKLIQPGSDEEKWHQIINVLGDMRNG